MRIIRLYSLKHVFLPVGRIPGFAIPVLSMGGWYFRQVVERGQIRKFERINFENDDSVILTSYKLKCGIGDPEYFALVNHQRRIVIETRDQIRHVLSANVSKYTNPYTLLEVAEFIGDATRQRQAIAAIRGIEADFASEYTAKFEPDEVEASTENEPKHEIRSRVQTTTIAQLASTSRRRRFDIRAFAHRIGVQRELRLTALRAAKAGRVRRVEGFDDSYKLDPY